MSKTKPTLQQSTPATGRRWQRLHARHPAPSQQVKSAHT